ncbi:hypothetical protein HHI36_015128 [Cryptolaemus montrouzieri]|uniref:Uncharacterized protein n=1 Tax=Cryptolaemus montrouzieri TaxID=559131 RepID=A0ABD2N507_9CUCU
MDDKKKEYSALTIDRAAFLLLRVKKAFKKKKLQRKERERNCSICKSLAFYGVIFDGKEVKVTDLDASEPEGKLSESRNVKDGNAFGAAGTNGKGNECIR